MVIVKQLLLLQSFTLQTGGGEAASSSRFFRMPFLKSREAIAFFVGGCTCRTLGSEGGTDGVGDGEWKE